MKNLIILILAFIFGQTLAENKESINSILSSTYSSKIFARGKLQLINTDSKECLYLYYDGTYKQVSIDDGHYTIEIQNPNKLNILLVNPDSINISMDNNEKNKILGLVATNPEYQFYTLEKEDFESENKQLAEWKINDAKLEKNNDESYKIPTNTLIVPIYNKKINLGLANSCWKRDFNCVCLPSITINGKKDEVDTTIRKACWLHLKIGQLHCEQKSKKHKSDNKEISFLS